MHNFKIINLTSKYLNAIMTEKVERKGALKMKGRESLTAVNMHTRYF